MKSEQLKVLQLEAAHGDFYVESSCCTACGVPLMVAPDLIGKTNERLYHCYWKKQPETPEEMEHALAVFDAQELGCHRYAGHDPKIQLRVGSGNCDFRDAWRDSEGLPIETAEVELPRLRTEPTFWQRIRTRFIKR